MSSRIFISFASQDHRVAMTLCSALESRGFDCWISSRDIPPGENFQIAIVRAIRDAKIMLLVFTSNSNNSDEMNKELALASQNKLMVVPLRIEDVAPNDAFAYEFATRQWIDFFADWEAAIQQLSDRLAFAMRVPAAAAAPPESVPEPTPVLAAAPASVAPAEAPEEAPRAAPPPPAEPIAATANDDDAEPPRAEPDDEAELADRPPPSRRLIYIAASVVVLIAASLGLAIPGLMHSKPAHPQPRVMALVKTPAAPPSAVQRASLEQPTAAAPAGSAVYGTAAAEPTDPAAAADKPPPPRKKKPRAVRPADDVPY